MVRQRKVTSKNKKIRIKYRLRYHNVINIGSLLMTNVPHQCKMLIIGETWCRESGTLCTTSEPFCNYKTILKLKVLFKKKKSKEYLLKEYSFS